MGKTDILSKKRVKDIVFNGIKTKGGYRRKPSPKALLAVQNLVESRGSKKEALRKAGYGKSIQQNPHQIFETEPVQAVMRELYPTDKIVAAIDRNIVAGDLKQKYFDDEVSEAEIKELFEGADLKLIKIFRKRKSDRTGWHKIAYFKVTNPDAQIRSAELGAKITGIIKKNSPEEEVANKFLIGMVVNALRSFDN